MRAYLDLMQKILEEGEDSEDRTGVGTKFLFGEHLTIPLSSSFPLLTTRRLYWKGIVWELCWFLQGRVDVGWLQERGVHIWDEWAQSDGTIGPGYGYQWRSWPEALPTDWGKVYAANGIDQIQTLVDGLRNNPFSRRHILSAWNVADLPRMALPPCHLLSQYRVHQDGRLDCLLTQRSADFFLGASYNIASYALLTYLLAHHCGYTPGKLVISYGDLHLYNTHLDQARLQLTREPRPLPTLTITGHHEHVWDYTLEDLVLTGYHPHPNIKAPVAV